MMENLKLLSVRLYPETIAKINALSKHYGYWKKNTIIRNILKNVFYYTSDADLYQLMSYYPRKGQKLKITFEIVEEDEQ